LSCSTRIAPTETQIEVGLEGFAALGSARQIGEEEPGSDFDRLLVRWQPRLILRRRARERPDRGEAEKDHCGAV
jgi:hypothetical protein